VTDEMEGKHREWGEPIGGKGDESVQYISNSKENKKQTKVNTDNKKRQREKTFLIDKSQLKTDHSWKCPDIHSQFELFSKFGDSGSIGIQITLSQADRWLRQAQVIDGWNVTTIDTAIAFRKISKGSIWLEYKLWRAFIEYLSKQKHLNLSVVIDKLEKCGKPSLNYINRTSACKSS
jgi:hypothetical protein